MKFIKDNKIFNLPIELKIGEKIVQTNDIELLKKNGYEVYVENKKSLQELINESNELINRETDEKILNDFVWNGNEFYLTMENQFNFKTLYDLKEFQEFPITIKTKNGFTELNDMGDLSGFYLDGVKFIENCIKEGWTKKAAAELKIKESYEK